MKLKIKPPTEFIYCSRESPLGVELKGHIMPADEFLKNHENEADLIFTDPPFGIEGHKLDRHYKRNQKLVIKGYKEAPSDNYEEWAYEWIKHLDKALKPNGSIVIVSGWTHEADIQHAMKRTGKFELVNQLVWNFNFGVHTKRKFVTSHYIILWYCKKGAQPYFNRNAFHDDWERNLFGGSMVYEDLQSVIKINKEYQQNCTRYQNQLPRRLVEKIIKHLSQPGDIILDPFAGSYTIPIIAAELGRNGYGGDINPKTLEILEEKVRRNEHERY